jgi:uncharacterized RDD family membrane protein YckC
MQTIAIKTAQNIEIDYEVAGLGERIIARIIDYSLFLAIFLLYIWIFGRMHFGAVLWDFTLPEIIYFVFYVFYDLATETLFNGQSLGKYIMKIRVISLDGGRPRLGQYLLRYIFRAVDFVLTLQVGAIISIAMTDNKQRIGDIVANTTLIKTKARTQFDALNNVEVETQYTPVFMQATLLSDKDIALIHEVMKHYNKSADIAFIDSMANRVKTHLDVNLPDGLNNYKFLETILKDYNYLTLSVSPQIG